MSFSWSHYMTYSCDDDYTLLIVTKIFVEHVELHHESHWKFTTGRMVVANDRFHQLTKRSSFPPKWASTLWKSSTRSWRFTHVTYTAFHFPACSSPSFQALFGDQYQILCTCTLKLPIPPDLQQLPAWTTTITRRIITLELCVKSATIWG